MSRGIVMFAHNNPEIDYGLLALCNALMIKSNLKENKVALITDYTTYDDLKLSKYSHLISRAFDEVVQIEPNDATKDSKMKRFNDTFSKHRVLPWHNTTRNDAYNLSPFDETLLLDSDYLVCSPYLDTIWDTKNEIMLNHQAKTLNHAPNRTDVMVNPFTIPLHWATMLYFKKGKAAELMFDIVSHVKENYEYYGFIYGFDGRNMYRNDFAFSIAAHMLNGYRLNNVVASFPYPTILTSYDYDDLVDMPERNSMMFLVNNQENRREYGVSVTKDIDVHVMNKYSILRLADKIVELHGGAQ